MKQQTWRQQFHQGKKSLVQIVNEDIMCISRVVAVSWAHINKITNEEWREVTEHKPKYSMLFKVMKCRKVRPLPPILLLEPDQQRPQRTKGNDHDIVRIT